MSVERSLLTPKKTAGLQKIAVVSCACFIIGAWLSPERAGAGLLFANIYFVSFALSAFVFITVHNLSSAGWPTMIRRVPEAMLAYLPVGAAITALLALGARFVYPWAAPGVSQGLGGKAAYLNAGMFALRAAAIWFVWIFFAWKLVALSRKQDLEAGAETTRRARAISAAGLVALGLTFTVASVDWLMSLELHWTSTLYPWYLFSGVFEGGLAALAVLVVALSRRGFLEKLNEHHLHDLGKYILAFSCFWAYLWFCQYLLIWYSNLPDETAHYILRSTPGWKPLFWLNPIVNFVAPFFLLLPARRKKKEQTLLLGAGVVLVGRALDLYVLIMPPTIGTNPAFSLAEPAAFMGLAAIFLLAFDLAFAQAAPEPVGDPYLEESHHFAGI